MKPTKAQLDFFDKLLEEKEFGIDEKTKEPRNTDTLKEQFAEINQKSASAWIQAAIALPKIDTSEEKVESAPF